MSIEYLYEKTNQAVSILASGLDPLAVRLQHAYFPSLMSGINDAELESYAGKELLDRLTGIRTRLEGTNRGEDEQLPGSLVLLNDQEAQELADEILGVAAEVEYLYWRSHGAR
jgi:hypothetical protein